MFSSEYKLRYSDTGIGGRVKICTVIDLLQDISVKHAAFAGLGAERLKKEGIAFLLDGWRIRFDKSLNTDEAVIVKTGIMRLRKFETIRKYEIWQGGECKITATAMWYSVNIEKRSIARLDEEFYSGFDNVEEEDNGLEYVNLRPDKSAAEVDTAKIARRDIDTNGHMNNMRAVDFLMDFLPRGKNISELKVKYRKELFEGEKVKILISDTEDGCYAEIRNSEDKSCVLIKM